MTSDPTSDPRWWKLYRVERLKVKTPREQLTTAEAVMVARRTTRRYRVEQQRP